MKNWNLLILLVVAVVVSCAFSLANAASITMSMYTPDTDTFEESGEVPVYYESYADGRGQWYIGYSGTQSGYTWETGEGKIELYGALDPDPSLTFGSVAFDFGAPSNFSFTFILPLAPFVSNPSIVSDSFAGSVTNGPNPQVDGGVTVTALPPPVFIPEDADGITEMQVFTLSDDGGLTWKNVGLDAGETEFVPLAAGGSGNITAYNQGPIPTIPHAPLPFNAWTHMRADINFGLSGGGDFFTFNGAKVLEVIPEPGTLLLAVLPLAGYCCFRRRAVR